MRLIKASIILALTAFVLTTGIEARAESSEKIRKEIFSKIESNGTIRGYELDVDARDGVVLLRGTVASDADKTAVRELAKEVDGVSEVRDQLTVDPLASVGSPELARAVQSKIKEVTASANHAVTIAAEGNAVTLSGVVASENVKRKVVTAAQATSGVAEVVSNLTVSRPTDTVIAERIKTTIERTPDIEIKDFDVQVQNGIATLSGTGKTHKDIDHALALANMVDGVEDVKSNFSDNGYRWDPQQERAQLKR